MKQVFAFLAFCLCAWSVPAQQVMPVRESQRVYAPIGEIFEKSMAAAVARRNPGTTENVSQEESYKRVLEFAKILSIKPYAKIAGNDFSYMAFLPFFTGKLYGEVSSYTFSASGVTVIAELEPGAFQYRMGQIAQAAYYVSPVFPNGRIYEPDMNHAFKTMPRMVGTTYSVQNLCTTTGTNSNCARLNPFSPGSFKWFWRDSGQPWMVACNDLTDCVKAASTMLFYARTFSTRATGYNSFSQYFGNYAITPSGNCAHNRDFAYLTNQLISGMICIYSERYEYTTGSNSPYFTVTGDYENKYLRYISLAPVPVQCGFFATWPQLEACDPRYKTDVLSVDSLVRMFDRAFQWGSSRIGYRGVRYVPIVAQDVIAALGGRFVKVSALAEPVALPASIGRIGDGSGTDPGTGGGGVDLGQDPATPPPAIESINGAAVLAPILDLFPSFRSYSGVGQAGQCPTFTSSLFGGSYAISAHCQLTESNRVALGVMSLIAWAATALVVVVRA